MRKGFVAAIVFVLCAVFMVGSVWAQREALNSLNFRAVKKVTISKKTDGFWADVLVELENKSDLKFRLRDFTYDLFFQYEPRKPEGESQSKSADMDGDKLKFGRAEVKMVKIPQASAGTPSVTLMELKVFIGENNDETVKKILGFMSLVGNPGEIVLYAILHGTGEIGTELDKGWVYQGNMKLELELRPRIQREVLLE